MDLSSLSGIKAAFDILEKAISEHASAAVLRDHVAFLRDKLQIVLKENEELKKENAKLVDLCRTYEKELKAKAIPTDFIEHRGALFKRLPSGDYSEAVYCPSCKVSTSSLMKTMPYTCKKCGWKADFSGSDLAGVLATLAK